MCVCLFHYNDLAEAFYPKQLTNEVYRKVLSSYFTECISGRLLVQRTLNISELDSGGILTTEYFRDLFWIAVIQSSLKKKKKIKNPYSG